MKLQSANTIFLLISLLLIFITATNCVSLRQFYNSRNTRYYNNSTFTAKFTHREVSSDHQIMLEKRKTQSHIQLREENEFIIPKDNFRVLTIFTLKVPKLRNPTLYASKKEEFHIHILEKPLRDETMRVKELEMLEKWDVSLSCTWFHALPAPFDTNECWVKEYDFIVTKMDELLEGKIEPEIQPKTPMRAGVSDDEDEV